MDNVYALFTKRPEVKQAAWLAHFWDMNDDYYGAFKTLRSAKDWVIHNLGEPDRVENLDHGYYWE